MRLDPSWLTHLTKTPGLNARRMNRLSLSTFTDSHFCCALCATVYIMLPKTLIEEYFFQGYSKDSATMDRGSEQESYTYLGRRPDLKTSIMRLRSKSSSTSQCLIICQERKTSNPLSSFPFGIPTKKHCYKEVIKAKGNFGSLPLLGLAHQPLVDLDWSYRQNCVD